MCENNEYLNYIQIVRNIYEDEDEETFSEPILNITVLMEYVQIIHNIDADMQAKEYPKTCLVNLNWRNPSYIYFISIKLLEEMV